MIITILLTLLVAKIRGYRVLSVFKEPCVYPFFFLEIMLIIFQICVFCGVYVFVPYAKYVKLCFMLSMLWPFFKFKLYKQGIAGSICVFVGSFLNQIVINANGGKMPAFPTLSYWTGYIKPDYFSTSKDALHVLGNSMTKYWLLSDVIDVGYCVLSVGDLLVRVFVFIMLFAVIQRVCEKRKEKKPA